MKILNPATGAVIAEVPEASVPARIAPSPRWASTPLAGRADVIRRFRALLVERKEKLAQTLTAEVGKPIAQSRSEIDGTLGRIDYFLEQVPKVLRDDVVHREEKLEERITLEPLGAIVNISAWNYPYYVGSNVFLPALLTGNTVLYKPSEFATLTGLAIGDLLRVAGLPEGAFTVFPGTGAVGAELLKQKIGGVFFTGSYATGRKIAESVAGRMIRVQLELGGKDPVYVCDDVDVPAAAEATADGAFYNAGQSCCAIERLYVHRRIHEPFVAAFVKTVQGFKIGDPTDPSTYIGPLARAAQVGVLEDQVADAVAKGARVLTGGKRLQGNYFEPTVLVDVDHTMKVMRDESFGPVIGIMAVDDDDRALALMADSEYGLTAGVYTKDRTRAEALLARIDAGSAYWNCCDRVSPRLPWSGRGHSGIGSTLSTHGILSFVQPKGWHLRG